MVVSGALVARQDALGMDYNSDGRGLGYNVPSLLGLHNLPPYLHNGAAESLAQLVADTKHRTANGTLPDLLTNATDRALLVKFLESIDGTTSAVFPAIPPLSLNISSGSNYVAIGWDSAPGHQYAFESRKALDEPWLPYGLPVTASGSNTTVFLNLDTATRFLRLVYAP